MWNETFIPSMQNAYDIFMKPFSVKNGSNNFMFEIINPAKERSSAVLRSNSVDTFYNTFLSFEEIDADDVEEWNKYA